MLYIGTSGLDHGNTPKDISAGIPLIPQYWEPDHLDRSEYCASQAHFLERGKDSCLAAYPEIKIKQTLFGSSTFFCLFTGKLSGITNPLRAVVFHLLKRQSIGSWRTSDLFCGGDRRKTFGYKETWTSRTEWKYLKQWFIISSWQNIKIIFQNKCTPLNGDKTSLEHDWSLSCWASMNNHVQEDECQWFHLNRLCIL